MSHLKTREYKAHKQIRCARQVIEARKDQVRNLANSTCTVECQDIKVVRFLGWLHLCLFLNYVNQTTKRNLSKNHYQLRSTGFPQQKTNFWPPSVIIFFINNYFNLLMPDGSKRSNILKQTCTQKFMFISIFKIFCYQPVWEL